jgi:hypothetical protein
MGTFEKSNGHMVYRQDGGEITAWFASDEEKRELDHQGTPGYRRAFLLLVALGAAYLAFTFLRY